MIMCSHLILLGESQVVIGFQQLYVLGQLADGNGRVAHHSCMITSDMELKGLGNR